MGRETVKLTRYTCDVCSTRKDYDENETPHPYETEKWAVVDGHLVCDRCYNDQFVILPLHSHMAWEGLQGDILLKTCREKDRILFTLRAVDGEFTYITEENARKLVKFLTEWLDTRKQPVV